MNVANLEKLITHLKVAPAESFNLGVWIQGGVMYSHVNLLPVLADTFDRIDNILEAQRAGQGHECGTVACIAGYAALIMAAEDRGATALPAHKYSSITTHYSIQDAAAEWLGLDPDLAYNLFVPEMDQLLEVVSKDEAILVLEHLRDTGKVDWSVAGYEVSQEYEP